MLLIFNDSGGLAVARQSCASAPLVLCYLQKIIALLSKKNAHNLICVPKALFFMSVKCSFGRLSSSMIYYSFQVILGYFPEDRWSAGQLLLLSVPIVLHKLRVSGDFTFLICWYLLSECLR